MACCHTATDPHTSERLWDREPTLWEAARAVTISRPAPATDPQPEGTWVEASAVNLSTRRLKVGLWGPTQRPTLSLGKTDVWDRRRYSEPPLTLAEIKDRMAKGVVMPSNRADHYRSWAAYDFPCTKPVGQVIVLCPDLEGAKQPVAVTHCDDATTTLEIVKGNAMARLTYLMMMTRNLIAVDADFQGLRNALSVRLYRHRDINGRDTSIFGALNSVEPRRHQSLPTPSALKGYDYSRDKDPDHGPLDPPTSGCDGKYFWIRQRLPAERTFPQGFEYVMAGIVVGSAADIETVEGQRGLGTPPDLNLKQKELVAGRKPMWHAMPNYEPIRRATGAAATATLPRKENHHFTFLVATVTSAESTNPLEEAKRRLAKAEAEGFAALRAENAAWYRALYERREKGRIFRGNAEFAKSQVPDAFHSWTLAHHDACDPDPTRYEAAVSYNYLEQDWDPFHGLPCYNELFFTSEHVRNRSDRLSYYYKLVNFWLPACMKNAREVFGLPGAALLHGYLPPIIPGEYAHCSATWEFCMEIPAQVIKCLWDCFDYGGDERFLADVVYPGLRETAIFYSHYVTPADDGAYHVIPTVSAEHWGWTPKFERNRDSTSALCMFKWLLERAATASDILGCDADLRARWRETAARLAPCPTYETPEGLVFTDVAGVDPIGVEYNWFGGAYPCELADEINLDSSPDQRKMMLRTARLVKGWNVKNIAPLLAAEKGIKPEQLINSRSGRIHLFPAIPEGATVAFRDMQARGGFEVSAECVEGGITYVAIRARRNGTCRLMNPWPGSRVKVIEQATGQEIPHELDTRNGECVTFAAKPGCRDAVTPATSGSEE